MSFQSFPRRAWRAWRAGHARVAAGASAPEILVQEVIAKLQSLGASRVTQLEGIEENVVFPLPKGLGGLGGTALT